MVNDIVQTALAACDGIEFSDRAACPSCGGAVRGYDTRIKQFAVILEDERKRVIHVRVRRFTCKTCGQLCSADEPFYPDTRIGSPIVDLCITLAATMPFHRAAAYLENLGIEIDRGTVRNYIRRAFPEIPTTDIFGIRLPLSIISLSELAARAGEGSRIPGTETLAACGFPSAYRAAPDRLLPLEQGKERKQEEDKEERQTEHP
jgi:hypothetical protein